MTISRRYIGQEPLRLNKFMAQEGLCSRREAEALIADGLITINGETISAPGHKIEPGQTVTLAAKAGRRLNTQFTAIVHKPVGIVSAQPEKGQTPAARLLTKTNQQGPAFGGRPPSPSLRLAPLGRLDMDSRGLLLLSEDGVLAKALIGPESKLEKEYVVRVSGKITADALARLNHGLSLDGRKLKPAKVTRQGTATLRFILREGRNRQIRRMAELVDLRVRDLYRVRIGPLHLEPLKEGCWRYLTSAERTALITGAGQMPSRSKPHQP